MSITEAVTMVSQTDELAHFSILEQITTLSSYEDLECNIAIPYVSMNPMLASAAVKKGSPYYGVIQYSLLKYMEGGMFAGEI